MHTDRSSGMGSERTVGRVAALYDIHGNLPALEGVLAEVARERVDMILVGGDVMPGPMPRETLDRLLALDIPTRFILGNGEAAVLEQMAGREPLAVPPAVRPLIRWVAEQLAAGGERRLAWPATATVNIEGLGDVLFCHATPRSNTDIFTRLTPDARVESLMDGAAAPVVVCGHTHMQFDRIVGARRIVNAGSVGMPFGDPGAYWLLLGPGVELRRTSFDLHGTADAVRKTKYPDAANFAARSILQPPSEQEMLEAFRRAEPPQPQ